MKGSRRSRGSWKGRAATPPGCYSPRLQDRKRRYVRMPILPFLMVVLPPGCSVVDLGAGCGFYVQALRTLGYQVTGVDGTPGIEQITKGLVQQVDLVADDFSLVGVSQWATCIDVGEHVPKDHEQRFIDNVARVATAGMIVSWGLPGTRGIGHVNCQPLEYVAGEFARRGWTEDRETKDRFRPLCCSTEWSRLLVFKRAQLQ